MKKLELKNPFKENHVTEKVNVLLVDDKESNLLALEDTLSVLDENLVSVKSGKDALRALIDDEFAVILLDINMPEMDGYETATLIRDHSKTHTLPIIFVTAYDKGEPFVLEGYSRGAVDYILKPFNPEILLSKVRVYVDLFRSKKELHLRQQKEQEQKFNVELSKSKARLVHEEKLSAMGKLASLVGHELRAPLGVIKNSAAFINMRIAQSPDEKVVKHLGIIDEEINKSETIITNILDFARYKEVTLATGSLNDLILELISADSFSSTIKIKTNLDETAPSIPMDKELIRHVFMNIMRNAFQAMPDGGTLTISTVLRHQETIAVSFEDTGYGIAEENLRKIFEALFTTKHTGTGLGLSACENIIQAHGGSIIAESEEGTGALFTITLPTTEPDE